MYRINREDEMRIESFEQLRQVYPAAKERAIKKQLASLDEYARQYLSLSPFFVMATTNAVYQTDASPRGGVPGFVQVVDSQTLLIPDSSGNNRLDSLQNIVETGRIAMLFMIPGFDETLRINGRALISNDDALLARFSGLERAPRAVIQVQIEDVYLHCPKAFMRSQLWTAEALANRSVMPTMNEMIYKQTNSTGPMETQEQMLARYQAEL
jgi:PPOX class probable FMN-dependent enzyme